MSRARAVPPADISPSRFFSEWAPDAVVHDPVRRERIRDLDARIQFELEGNGGGCYFLHIHDGQVDGGEGALETPDLTLRTDVETWRQLNAGEIKAPNAVLKGRLKFAGSAYLALKIHFIIG